METGCKASFYGFIILFSAVFSIQSYPVLASEACVTTTRPVLSLAKAQAVLDSEIAHSYDRVLFKLTIYTNRHMDEVLSYVENQLNDALKHSSCSTSIANILTVQQFIYHERAFYYQHRDGYFKKGYRGVLRRIRPYVNTALNAEIEAAKQSCSSHEQPSPLIFAMTW